MAEKKEADTKRETKAGMLGKNNDSEARSEEAVKAENEPSGAPKIGKAEAEGKHDDKPIH